MKEFLFIVGFVITIVVRYTFTGIGDAEQKEEGGKQMTKQLVALQLFLQQNLSCLFPLLGKK